jgi:hypothetical protein
MATARVKSIEKGLLDKPSDIRMEGKKIQGNQEPMGQLW